MCVNQNRLEISGTPEKTCSSCSYPLTFQTFQKPNHFENLRPSSVLRFLAGEEEKRLHMRLRTILRRARPLTCWDFCFRCYLDQQRPRKAKKIPPQNQQKATKTNKEPPKKQQKPTKQHSFHFQPSFFRQVTTNSLLGAPKASSKAAARPRALCACAAAALKRRREAWRAGWKWIRFYGCL